MRVVLIVILTMLLCSLTVTAQDNPPTVIHTVQAGENLYRIAQYYGVSVDAIVAANNITDATRIFVGQTLVIPAQGGSPPAAALAPLTSTPQAAAAPAQAATPTPYILVPTVVYQPPVSIPTAVNNMPVSQFAVMSEPVTQHMREVYLRGQQAGNNPRAFSRLGDCNSEIPYFLGRFEDPGAYNLGEYGYLQGVIGHFTGSYTRQGAAVWTGNHSWAVVDPMFAGAGCLPNESPMACEYRQHRPSVFLIRLGTNDAGVPQNFEDSIREIIAFALDNGVIPVVGTKADRMEGQNGINNDILRRLAGEYRVPLWDFDQIAGTLPGRGLDNDGYHLNGYATTDYSTARAFTLGHPIQNLSALIMLDLLWREIIAKPFTLDG